MLASLKRKYALTDQGVKNVVLGSIATALTNIIIMAGMGALFATMQDFVATLTKEASLSSLASFALGLAVFIVALFVANWFQYIYTYGVVYAETGRQRIGLAEHLRRLPLSFFGQRDLADLTETIMGDVATMEHAYSHVLGELYGAIISTAIVFLGSLVFAWQLSLAAFWSVPVAFLVLFATQPLMQPLFHATRQAGVDVSEKIQETLDCVREVRATGQEECYLLGLDAKIDEVERIQTKGEMLNGLIVNSAFVILRLGLPTTILVGGILIVAGRIDFMTMFAFLLMVSRIYAPFDQCLMLMSELFIAKTAAERMKAIYEQAPASGSSEFSPSGHSVTFKHVSFSYDSAARQAGLSFAGTPTKRRGLGDSVLCDVSFTAREGEVTALVGPSGSGKSTCTRLAARFWDASAGSVTVGGVDVSTVDPEVLLRDFSVVFQDVLLFDDTVMGNIRLGRRDATDKEVLAAAAAANCDEFVERLPEGYNTMIGENGSKLSGGERQRISIARALLKDAPIVLLDEATASLDVENETKVQGALSRLLAGKTVIVIAHRMRTVENADKVVVLREGRVVEQGSPANLMSQNGEFAHMVALQRESANWSL